MLICPHLFCLILLPPHSLLASLKAQACSCLRDFALAVPSAQDALPPDIHKAVPLCHQVQATAPLLLHSKAFLATFLKPASTTPSLCSLSLIPALFPQSFYQHLTILYLRV